FSERKILDQLKELIKENNLSDKNARVRIQVSLSEKQGYSSGDDMPLISMITATSIQERKEVQSLILAENSVVSTSARPTHLKLSNMLHYRNAYREAEQKGADDAILLNHDGFVAETSIANIFWKKDDVIYTPSDECDILPGIMRNSIIDILRNRMQVPVKEGRFGVDELMEADSIWLTNSTVGFIPVLQIQDTSFKTKNEFLSELEKELPTYKEEYMTDV
ncbi:MAG: aminotransferase class IV, partial [Balneolaceae bacterium]|nr:aminotransferase class IV [Balneolaceae bacterium]